MRIGFDAKRAFSNFTGLGNYSRSTIRILNEYHFENDYFLYSGKVPNEEQIGFLDLPKHGKSHIRIPKSLFFETFTSAWRRYGIAADAAHDQLDIYHGLSHELPAGIEKTNIKTVVTIHDLIFKRFPTFYKAADRRIYDKKFKSACKQANKIIAISEQTKSDIIEYYKIDAAKIEVIYQSCSPIFYRMKEEIYLRQIRKKYNLPDRFLLNVGTIEERKNTLVILKAMLNSDEKIPLVLVGRKKTYFKQLEDFISKNNLQDRFIHLEKIDFEDLPAIYQMATVFIYPSRFEGFGIPIIEALHSGTPVIAATGSCLAEAGGPGSLYFNPDDNMELASKINLLLDDQALRAKMVADGLNYVQHFKDEKIAEKINSLYQNLIRNE